jgi:L-ascorbate metabolism protein UlaG (beta-lactamase superfamily)
MKTIDNTSGSGKLHFMGRSSIRIETANGIVIYVDPFAGKKKEYKVPADLVLVTHQHRDHNNVSLITLKEGGRIIQCPFDIKSGDTIETHGIIITAVDAYNKNHQTDSNCGYILALGNMVIYHSGDTSTTEQMPELSRYNIDYAILCTDGHFNMGVDEAMKAAEMIDARYVVPVHTSPFKDYSQKTIDNFILENKIAMKPGDTVTLD